MAFSISKIGSIASNRVLLRFKITETKGGVSVRRTALYWNNSNFNRSKLTSSNRKRFASRSCKQPRRGESLVLYLRKMNANRTTGTSPLGLLDRVLPLLMKCRAPTEKLLQMHLPMMTWNSYWSLIVVSFQSVRKVKKVNTINKVRP